MRDMVGKFIPEGIAVGIEANTDSIDEAIDNINDEIINKENEFNKELEEKKKKKAKGNEEEKVRGRRP